MSRGQGCARAGVATATLAAVLLAVAAWAQPPAPAPPDLAGAEPRVAAKITALRNAAELAPRDPEAWGRYGMGLDAHRYTGAAAAAYLRAAELDPRDFRWPYFLGALYEAEAPAEAARWLEAALAIDGAYGPAHIRLARTLEALDRRDQALRHYLEAARLDPDDPLGDLGAGRIALAQGDVPGAIAHLERAREHGPEIQAVAATLARAYQRAGDTAKAQALAAEARELPRMLHHRDPRHAAIAAEAVDRESYLRRSRTALEVGRLEEARAVLQALLGLAPDDAEAWLALARVESRLGRTTDSLHAVDRAVQIDPRIGGGQAARADALFELQRVDEADRAARSALEQDPDNVRLRLLASMTAAARGDAGAATAHLDRAYAIGTSDRELRGLLRSLLQELAQAFEDTGNRADAARRWEQALRLAEADGAPTAERSAIQARIDALRGVGR